MGAQVQNAFPMFYNYSIYMVLTLMNAKLTKP